MTPIGQRCWLGRETRTIFRVQTDQNKIKGTLWALKEIRGEEIAFILTLVDWLIIASKVREETQSARKNSTLGGGP